MAAIADSKEVKHPAEPPSLERAFFDHGWCRFPFDPAVAAWVEQALPSARRAVADQRNAHWLRCGGTWFAGVNVLDNDEEGAVAAAPKLAGPAIDFIREHLGPVPALDRGQVSVCYPGYPRRGDSETESAFGYRRDRDAAHLDGIVAEDPERRRHVREHHAFILGIPLLEASPGASPLVVWEGSHALMRRALRAAFANLDPARWASIDVTDIYRQARRQVFQSCRRVAIPALPGEAYLVHRLALHGMAPWSPAATTTSEGRMVVYFRPLLGAAASWLADP